MENSVVIKGNKHGISVVLDETLKFEQLKNQVKDKFAGASKFFGSADMAISFEGRKLTSEEETEILNIISEVSDVRIVCVIENDALKDSVYEGAVRSVLDQCSQKDKEYEQEMQGYTAVSGETDNDESMSTAFCKGTLRSGQLFESKNSVVVLGDVNPGAKVISKGNVIILGSLRGNVYAGADGNENAFVVALEMNPMQIKIADVIARSADTTTHKKSKNKNVQPKIAYVGDGNIYIDEILQEVLNDLTI